MGPAQDRLEVVIAGGGVAALEALLALHDLAGERLWIRLLAPVAYFIYRRRAVLEPFRIGERRRYPLGRSQPRTAPDTTAPRWCM